MVQDLEVINGPCHHRMLEGAHFLLHNSQGPLSVRCLSQEIRRGWSDLTYGCHTASAALISSLGQLGAISPRSVSIGRALSVGSRKHQDAESFLMSDLEKSLCAEQETQPDLGVLKGSDEQEAPNINLRPAWWQMEKEIPCMRRSDLSFNYASRACMWSVNWEKPSRSQFSLFV